MPVPGLTRRPRDPHSSSQTRSPQERWRIEKERGADDSEQDGEVIKVRLAKHRNGPTGGIDLWFRKRQTRFVSVAAEERYAGVEA